MADTPVLVPPTGLIGRVNVGGSTLKRVSGYLNLTAASNRESYGMVPVSAIGFKPKIVVYATRQVNGGYVYSPIAVDVENKTMFNASSGESRNIIFPDLTARVSLTSASNCWGNMGGDITAKITTVTYGGVPYKCIVNTTDSGDGTYGDSVYIREDGSIQVRSKTAYYDGSSGYIAAFYYYILG